MMTAATKGRKVMILNIGKFIITSRAGKSRELEIRD
jgi:hypothetical protein